MSSVVLEEEDETLEAGGGNGGRSGGGSVGGAEGESARGSQGSGEKGEGEAERRGSGGERGGVGGGEGGGGDGNATVNKEREENIDVDSIHQKGVQLEKCNEQNSILGAAENCYDAKDKAINKKEESETRERLPSGELSNITRL